MPRLRASRSPARHVRRRVWARLILPGVLVALIGSSAFAYWSADGTGSGNGSTASGAALTLSPGIASADLRPGGLGDVVLQVSNPSPSVAKIGSLVLDVTQGADGYAVDAAHSSCALTVLGFTTQTNAGAGWTVAAASGGTAGTLSITVTEALQMSGNAANACQGATLTVYLAVGS